MARIEVGGRGYLTAVGPLEDWGRVSVMCKTGSCLAIQLTRLLGDLRVVGGLDVDVDTLETAVECVLGRGVDHLVADVGIVGRPGVGSANDEERG